MKSILPFFALAIIFTSCTTAYKTGQTPDDVYFSPARPQDEYVRVDSRNDDSEYRYNDSRYRRDEDYYNDRYLRMRVRNRYVWSELDYYYSNPYVYNPYTYKRYNRYSYDNIWNSYSYWNYYYNPYSPVIVVNTKNPVYNKPRTTNLHVFDVMNSTNPKIPNAKNRDLGGYNQPRYNSGRDLGRDLRNVFGGSSNSGSSSSPSKTSSSGSSSSSSSSNSSDSKSSSGNAPVRKF
jgi:hypothetical protein